MTKQKLTKKILRQQLIHLDQLGNEQLNELLQQLERQKEKLPVEDHPIINWGINLIRAKAQEEDRLRNEMSRKFYKYTNYSTFIAESGWESLDLNNPINQTKLRDLGKDELEIIINESYTWETFEIIQKYVPLFKQYLDDFCADRGLRKMSQTLIQKYIKFCQESAIHFDEQGSERADYYKELLEELESPG